MQRSAQLSSISSFSAGLALLRSLGRGSTGAPYGAPLTMTLLGARSP